MPSNQPGRRITMEELAAEAGVSHSTVSLALRNDPRVKTATRQRIRALAEKRGYRPDPALSALVAYRAQTRPVKDYGMIAVLHDLARPEEDFPFWARQVVDGIRTEAKRLGYAIELFGVNGDEKEERKLSRILYSRGICGVILAVWKVPELHLRWEHFSAVAIAEYLSSPRLNHVNNHHVWAMTIGYQRLRELGYRKIGFSSPRETEEKKHFLYLGAYLKCLYLDGIAPSDSPPDFYDATCWSPLPWLDRYGFDAVMSQDPEGLLRKLEGSTYVVPRRLGVAGVLMPKEWREEISGVAGDGSRLGIAAVRLVRSMMHDGQTGVPSEEEHVNLLLQGSWRQGKTVRRIR